MVFGFVLVPFIAAFIGWFINRMIVSLLFRPARPMKIFGLNIQGFLPRKKQELSAQIARLASSELLSLNDIAANISRPENVQKLMPQLEEHIDRFLKVKLPEQMPVIGMFIGDKTIAQLKSVFTSELETLFPVVMGSYVQHLGGEAELEKIIIQKLDSIPADRMERIIRSAMAREFRVFGWIGAVSGFLIGCIAVVIVLFLGV